MKIVSTLMRPRLRAATGATVVCLALLAATLPAAAAEDVDAVRGGSASEPDDAEGARGGPMLLLRSVTGIRSGAATVLGGAVLSQGAAAEPIAVVIEDLPDGATLVAARPDRAAPVDGLAWSCADATCRLVDRSGSPATLAAGQDVPVTLAINGDLAAARGSLHVRAGDAPAVEVPLDLDDGAAPLAVDAISVAPSGIPPLEPGATVESTVSVGNLASGSLDPGSVTLVRSGGPVGTTATMRGEGWRCDAATCVLAAALAPLDTTPPLTVVTTAASGAADATAPASFAATARLGPTLLSASAAAPVAIAAARSHGVSVAVQLRQNSVSAPAETIADVRVAATGAGELREPVRVRVDVPDGIEVAWDRAELPEPWRCTAATSSCTSTGPLVAGTPSVLPLPIEVTRAAEVGTARIEVGAALVDDRGSAVGAEDRAGAGLVVNPPPVAELRATMRAADALTPVRGEPIEFAADVERDLVVTVTNQGSRPAVRGTEVEVQLLAEPRQPLRSAGGAGWRCDRRRNVGEGQPLRCTTTLDRDLLSGGSVELPVALEPAHSGSSSWTVRSGRAGDVQKGSGRQFRIDVGARAPSLTPQVSVVAELERGGTGELAVTLDNRGDGVARGGVLLLDLPGALQVESLGGLGWSCADATLRHARGSVSCTYSLDVEPGERGTALRVMLSTDSSGDSESIWAWATAPGQLPSDRSGVATRLDVHRGLTVDAGPDLTVVTPVRGADGSERPAVVDLDGHVPAGYGHVRWEQLCARDGARGCERTGPAVTWLGVAPDSSPETDRARFVAPADLDGPTTLQFELQAEHHGRVHSDRVAVRLVPTRVPGAVVQRDSTGASAGPGAGDTTREGGGSAGGSGGGSGGAAARTDDVSVTVGDGSVLQVATRTEAVLTARATGSTPLQYSWQQTAGPTATIAGGTDAAQLVLQAPDLAPAASSAQLEFEVTVTDADGNSASAPAQVQVVWGDDGLQVQVAGGAPSVVATVDTPLSITSTVTSAGAPYQFAWSLDGDVELPVDTTVDAAELSFTAPDEPGTGTVELKVTDSFGRVTTATVPLSISELPAGEVPAALCAALGQLRSGDAAQLQGAGVVVTIPAAGSQVNGDPAPTPSSTTTSSSTTTTTTTSSTTTTTPMTTTTAAPGCPATSYATFIGATIVLPGGVSVADAAGELSIAGVTLTSGTVSVPANWGAVELDLPEDGLLAPFVSSQALGVPTGALAGGGAPLVALPDWTTSTSVAFTATPVPTARISTVGSPTSGAGSLSLRGTAVGAGATDLTLAATGLVALGPLEVPLAGRLTTGSAAAPVVSTVSGAVSDRPVATDVIVGSLDVTWSPSSVSGTLTLRLGAGGSAVELVATAAFPTPTSTSNQVELQLTAGSSLWAPGGPRGPQFSLSGAGSLQGDRLDLTVEAAPVATWSPARATAISDLSASVRADCTLTGDTACGPAVALAGTLDARPVATSPVPLSGALDLTSGITTLRAAPGPLSVAPVTVADAAWTATLDGQGATVAASGSAQVLGAPRSTTVQFASAVVVAEAALGDRELVPGWTVDDAVALAADGTASYDFDGGGSTDTVDLVAGRLLGAGATRLPTALAAGVLPDSLQSGVVTFPVSDTEAGPYRLSLSDPDGWNVTPEAGDLAELSVTALDMEITADGQQATVALRGAAALRVAALDGGVSPTLQLSLNGSLTSDDGTGTLSATLSSPSWPSPFGFAGIAVDQPAVMLAVTPSTTSASLTGAASLAPALLGSLGAPPVTSPIGGELNAPAPVLQVDLAHTASAALDPGGSGLLSTDDAQLVLTPATDATVQQTSVARGATVLATLPTQDALQLQVAPADMAISGTVELGSVTIGGAPMTDVVVDVGTRTLTGSVTLGSALLPVSGAISPAAQPGSNGSIALAVESPSPIQLGGRTLTVSELDLMPVAIIGPGAPQVTLGTVISAFGSQVPVQLAGAIESGALGPLTGTVPKTTYALNSGDTIATDLTVAYGPPPGPSPTPSPGWALTVATTTTAVLSTDGWSFLDGTAQVAPDGGSFGYRGSILLPGSGGDGVELQGDYLTASGVGGAAGSFSLTTASDATFTLAGFTPSGSATIARIDGAAKGSLALSASFGLFDGDTAVALRGALTAPSTPGAVGTTVLTGAVSDTAFRGLDGTDATFTIRPGTGALKVLGAYVTDVVFQAAEGSCAFWASAPRFTGQTYRFNGTTFYTLSSDVDLTWPSGLAVSVPWGQYPQPIMFSNETVPGIQPAPGLTLQAGFSGAAYTALGMFAFDPVACSYSVGGTLVLTFAAGSQSLALAQNTQQGPLLQISDNQFGSGGSLPESIQVVRNEFQSNQLAAQLAAQVQDLQSTAASAAQRAALAPATVESFTAAQAAAKAEATAATARLTAANDELSAAQTAEQQAQARAAVSGAQEEVTAASNRVADATAALATATNEAAAATVRSGVYDDMVEYANAQVGESKVAATAAAAKLSAAEADQQAHVAQMHATPFMLTLDWTHCESCSPVDTFNIDGELLFGGKIILGADVNLVFGSDWSIQGSFTLGYQWQVTAGYSHLYAQGIAVIEGIVTVGYTAEDGWNELSFALQAQASLTVYLSLWFATWSATLAQLTAQVGLQCIPSPVTVSGSLTVDVFGFDPTFSFGPDQL